MINARRYMALLLFVLLLLNSLAYSQPASSANPSVDRLLARVKAYWALLGKGQKQQAALYVDKNHQNQFFKRHEPAFSKPRITALDLAGKTNEIWVTTTVKRNFSEIGEVDWPVREKWIYAGSNWFVEIVDPTTPFTREANPTAAARLSPEEIENRKAHIREVLHFESQQFDFGRVHAGASAFSSLKYRVEGTEVLRIRFAGIPPGLSLIAPVNGELQSGSDREVKLQWTLEPYDYDGPVRVPLIINAGQGEVEVPYEFSLVALVYSPVSAAPGRLVFLKGEKEKKIVIRNNSQKELSIQSVNSESGRFKVEPLPQVLPAGASATLTVTVTATPPDQLNVQDWFSLVLAEPVDSMSNLIVPALLNNERTEDRNSAEPTPQDLEELLKKMRTPSTHP